MIGDLARVEERGKACGEHIPDQKRETPNMTTGKVLSIGEAREQLTRLPEELAREHATGAVTITRRGKPVLALMEWDFYEALIETLEILGDEEQMALLRQSVRDVAEGRTVPWEKVKADLNLGDVVEYRTDPDGD